MCVRVHDDHGCGGGGPSRLGFRGRRAGPTIALLPLGTLLVQSHLGTAPMVAVVTAVALVLASWGHGTSRWSAPPWRPWASSTALAALMWLPPLLAQLRGDPGRPSLLLTDASGDGARAGARAALGALVQAFALRPSWTDPSLDLQTLARLELVIPVLLVLPLLGLVVALRRGDRRFVRGVSVALAATVASAGAAALVSGELFTYLLVGLRASAASSLALGLAACAAACTAHRRELLVVALSVAAVGLSVCLGVVQVNGDNPTPHYEGVVRELSAAVLASPAASAPVRIVDPEPTPGSEGVMLQLERAGLDVAVSEERFVPRVGTARVDVQARGRTEVIVAPLEEAASLRSTGWVILRQCRQLEGDERRRHDELRRRERELDAALGSGPPNAEELRIERFMVGTERSELLDGRHEAVVAYRPSAPVDARSVPAAVAGPC